MFGSGRTLYHPLYIDNLVDAFMLCLAPGVGNGREYLIADEEYYPIEEIVKAVGRALDVPLSIHHYPIMPVVVAGHICEKLCKPFGIVPPIFPRRVDWYRQNRAFDISPREAGARLPAADRARGRTAAHRPVVPGNGLPSQVVHRR